MNIERYIKKLNVGFIIRTKPKKLIVYRPTDPDWNFVWVIGLERFETYRTSKISFFLGEYDNNIARGPLM